MKSEDLARKSLGILLHHRQDTGKDEVTLLAGTVSLQNGALQLDYDKTKSPFPILPEWLDRVQRTPPNLLETFDQCEFFFSLSMGALPDDANRNDFTRIGNLRDSN